MPGSQVRQKAVGALLLMLLFAAPCYAIPDTPVAKEAARPPKMSFDTGWWTRSLALAAFYDGKATRAVIGNCKWVGSGEGNPVSRALIGRCAQNWRMGVFGAAEVTGVALIPNRKLRRVVQISLIGAHIFCGTRNLVRAARK